MAEVPKAQMEEEKADSQTVSEDDGRQVLAPSEGPREDLIKTAIKFLQNPKVMGSPLHQKKAFLNKKGLTQEEINLAVQRAGVTEETESRISPVSDVRPPPSAYQPGAMALIPSGPYPPPAQIPPQSRWAQLRDLSVSSVAVVGFSYAMYHLYKTYLEPLFKGKSAHEKRLERLESDVEAIHKSVTDSLSEISKTLAAIQLSINHQNQQSGTNQSVGRGITDLKADISSLRSLLLNKNQFPAPPSTQPILPAWQLAGASSQTHASTDASLASPITSSSSFSMPCMEEIAVSASQVETAVHEITEPADQPSTSTLSDSLSQEAHNQNNSNPVAETNKEVQES